MVGRPAGDLGGRLLLVAARPRRDQGRERTSALGYLDPGSRTPASPRSSAPTHDDDRRDRRRPVRPILQTYLPILPKHIWGKVDLQDDRRRRASSSPTAPARRHRPVPGRSSGRPASSSASCATPTTGASRASQDEIVIQFFKQRRHDGPGAQDRRARLRPRRQRRPVQRSSRPSPNIETVAGARTAGPSSAFNSYGTGTGKTIKGGGPSTKALQDPAFRDALGYAIDKQTLVDNGPRRLRRRSARRIVPPVLTRTGTSTRRRRARSTSTMAKQKLDAAGYKLDANGQAARQGRQADQPAAGHARLRRELRQGRASSSRTGSASSGSR